MGPLYVNAVGWCRKLYPSFSCFFMIRKIPVELFLFEYEMLISNKLAKTHKNDEQSKLRFYYDIQSYIYSTITINTTIIIHAAGIVNKIFQILHFAIFLKPFSSINKDHFFMNFLLSSSCIMNRSSSKSGSSSKRAVWSWTFN